jgi:iron(III) transport system substrate-binding protein
MERLAHWFGWMAAPIVAGALVIACSPAAAPAPAKPSGDSGTGPPTALPELAVYQGADRQQLIEAGARKEGKLTWYTSLAGDIIDRLLGGFKEKYPFIQTDVFRGAENELLTRITQEAQAGQHSFDVMESQYTPVRILFDAKLLTPYYSSSLADIPADFKTVVGNNAVNSATVRISYISFGYNTSLLPESAVPKTQDDLMSPALAGKLALAGSSTGHRWIGAVLEARGNDAGRKWLTDFAANQKPVVQQVSGKALLDLIAKGELVASPTIFEDHVSIASESKAPVKWVPIEPVTANIGQGALAAHAPHPNAALLFLDYLLGDGQKVLKASGYSTAKDNVHFKWWSPELGKTADQNEKDAKLWNSLFTATFRT